MIAITMKVRMHYQRPLESRHEGAFAEDEIQSTERLFYLFIFGTLYSTAKEPEGRLDARTPHDLPR